MIRINSQKGRDKLLPLTYGYSFVMYMNKFYVYGGYNKDTQQRIDTLYEINIISGKCKAILSKEIPARDNHSALIWNNHMIVFGGGGGYNCRWYNDVWSFSLTRRRWVCLSATGIISGYPVARAGHISWIRDNNMYISHGWNGSSALKDTWRFNLISHSWEQIDTHGYIPPCDSSSHVQLPDGDILLIGGGVGSERCPYIYKFCHSDFRWILFSEDKRIALSGHSSILIDNYVYTFGGTRHNSDKEENIYVICTDLITRYSYPVDVRSPFGYGSRTVQSSAGIYALGGSTSYNSDHNIYFYTVQPQSIFSTLSKHQGDIMIYSKK